MAFATRTAIESVLIYGGHHMGTRLKGLYPSSLDKEISMIKMIAFHMRRVWDIKVVYGESLQRDLSYIAPTKTMIVIPPGPSKDLEEVFTPEDREALLSSVHRGAKLLGTCGSAYWLACKRLWDPTCSSPPLQKGFLEAFPVTAVGPLFPQAGQPPGMAFEFKAAKVLINSTCVRALSGGGGSFFIENPDLVKPLALYHETTLGESSQPKKSPSAIVICQYGEGKVLLSMVHLDVGERDLDSLKLIIAALKDRKDDIDGVCRSLSPEEDRYATFSYLIRKLEE